MDIQITSPYGVKLLTAGKRLEEDITATIASSLLPSGELTVTENGTYDVYDKETVVVNVPIPDGYIQPSGNLDITENGSYNIADKATATVNVPTIIEVTELPTANIDTNAVYSMGGKLYRYEETTVSTTVAPSDLTGYTVTVPSGWTATAGYGYFYVYGQLHYNDAIVDFESIGIGKTFDMDAFEIINAVNNVTFYQTDFPLQTFTPSESFSFSITDGVGVETSLIQWLTNNNATFSKSEYAWVEYSSGGESVAEHDLTIKFYNDSGSNLYRISFSDGITVYNWSADSPTSSSSNPAHSVTIKVKDKLTVFAAVGNYGEISVWTGAGSPTYNFGYASNGGEYYGAQIIDVSNLTTLEIGTQQYSPGGGSN